MVMFVAIWQARLGTLWSVMARLGKIRQVWQGVACLVVVMHGKARQVWN